MVATLCEEGLYGISFDKNNLGNYHDGVFLRDIVRFVFCGLQGISSFY
jgi:hypothetical protein